MEIFGPTIQGEGAVIGLQTYFIRFGLCDYKCTMCDSMHAVDPRSVSANATWEPADQIFLSFLEHAKKTPNATPWVTFSGGNPCMHPLGPLVQSLRNERYKIAVETQGTFKPSWLHQCNVITVSPKGPGMGERFEQDKFIQFLTAFHKHYGLNIKVVVFDERDLEFSRMIMEILGKLNATHIPVYLSLGNPNPPGHGGELTRPEMTEMLTDRYLTLWEDIQNDPMLRHTRFLPQWHVYLWGNKKGV
jgi:7-carboxy-7-deazaguanine synthase